MIYFVSWETDIWVEKEKNSVVVEKIYISKKQQELNENVKANCALKIIIFTYFAFFLAYSLCIFFVHDFFR